jgi:hypothetical protein
MKHPVLPALHYGRCRIVEARLDQALDIVQRLNAGDIEWLRCNEPEVLAQKAVRLSGELRLLADAVGPEQVSLDDAEQREVA